jgi:hypothetical protein
MTTNIKQALVMGLVAGVLATIGYVLQVGDVFSIDVHALVNVFALALLTAVSAFLTNLGTTSRGNFLGAVNIKDID